MSRPQRLVRRQPLSERIKARLNPLDFLLWLSEEIETPDWDAKTTGVQIGLSASFLFLLLRANSGDSSTADDVFGDSHGSSWGTFFVQPLLWLLIAASSLNAFRAMTRSRRYRLFEANVENGPSTPSAQRVRVDSSPASSSPLRYLSDVLSPETAESRAHPDKSRDVWELAVWDPPSLSMQVLSFFSPGHVLIYMVYLPLAPLDPRPSVTVFKCLLLQAMLSIHLLLLQSRFLQQAKDTAILQKEVMHEYDTKYVHPRLHPVVREVATQVSIGEEGPEHEEVEVGTPATLIRRGFQTHPNPNYAKYFDPGHGSTQSQVGGGGGSNLFTPPTKPRHSDSFTPTVQSVKPSNFRKSLPPTSISSTGASSPKGNATTTNPPGTNFGGNLGVYSHSNSPLKKATSMGDIKSPGMSSPRNSREMAAFEQRATAERLMRQSSPVKENRRSTAQSGHPDSYQSTNPFAVTRPNRFSQERFPSRWS